MATKKSGNSQRTKRQPEDTQTPPLQAASPLTAEKQNEEANQPYVICLGASAGGLEALEQFFSAMPPNTGATFVVILHLSPDFKSLMPELISCRTEIPVSAAEHDTALQPNHIYIIPPRKNMVVRQGRLLLQEQDRTPGHALNLPIDIFLRSLANECPERAIAVILSGTGSDGSRGIRAVKDAGGIVFAQEPGSARFDGMPRSALDTGVVDSSAAPDRLAQQITDIVGRPAIRVVHDDFSDNANADELAPIVKLVRESFGLDLGYFRPTMMKRRVLRRMSLLGIARISDYVDKLREDPIEMRALKQDMLISVTGFFRDPDAFEMLKRHILNELPKKPRGEQFRIWVPGCASGEEVYSLAMVLLETMELSGRKFDAKIFATDIDESALTFASKGTYPLSSIAEVSSGRLAKYFVHNGSTFTVERTIREMVIFAHHNLVIDPPFTKLDVASCRNLLIYMEPKAQEHVLASLHFSLKQGGTLFLGSAESLGRIQTEFTTVDSKYKIYTKTRNAILPSMRRHSGLRDPGNSPRVGAIWREKDQSEAIHQIFDVLLEQEERTAALITMDGTLIEVMSDPLGLLRIPKGKPTVDVIKIAVDELTIPLTTGLQRLKRDETLVRYATEIVDKQQTRHVAVKLRKLAPVGNTTERVLVLVEPAPNIEQSVAPGKAAVDKDSAKRMRELQLDLQQTRESLQATIEELQTSNEEQQSTNEELVASNEELQSTNEELQSVNEELYTVNDEYQKKNQELAVVAADLDNLLRNLDIGTLFLDYELCIRKFTPAVLRVIKLVDHDIGRSIEHFAHNLGMDFLADVTRVRESSQAIEREVRSAHGDWILMRINPYNAHSGKVEGVVVTFVDVTAIKNAQEMTRLSNDHLGHANRELSRQREELEDVFSIVAHDLKRPIVALNGFLSILQDEARSNVGVSELSSKALEECKRVKRMLDDLAHVSGMTRQEPSLEEVDLQPWLDEVVERFASQADQRKIRVNCVCDAGVVCMPRSALEEACVNLIENALKYGCDNARPRIDIACQLDSGVIVLSVRDNGKGIDPRNHNKVFEPFRRLEPEVADGSGVGLLAVKRLVSKHGGNISLESEPGNGAKFTIRLPIQNHHSKVATDVSKRPNVLLVEDDTLDAKVIKRHLQESYELTHVNSVSEAESKLKQEYFDMLLVDLSLPDGHGLDLVNRVKTSLNISLPVVIISGHMEGISPEAMTASVDACVSKADLTKDNLSSAMAAAFTNSRTHVHAGTS